MLGGRAPKAVRLAGRVAVNDEPFTKATRRRIGFVLQVGGGLRLVEGAWFGGGGPTVYIVGWGGGWRECSKIVLISLCGLLCMSFSANDLPTPSDMHLHPSIV